jgi:pilus assembly protein Flp/PilA
MRTIISLMNASRLLQDRRGATAIEYGLIAAGIGVTIAATVGLLGDQMIVMFDNIKTLLTAS